MNHMLHGAVARIGGAIKRIEGADGAKYSIVLGKPLEFLKESVWNSGNRYYVNGKRISFSAKMMQNMDPDDIRAQLKKYRDKNTYRYFDMYRDRFINANRERYESITEEAFDYIRKTTKDIKVEEMFISFSGVMFR